MSIENKFNPGKFVLKLGTETRTVEIEPREEEPAPFSPEILEPEDRKAVMALELKHIMRTNMSYHTLGLHEDEARPPLMIAQSAFNIWAHACVTIGEYREWAQKDEANELRARGLDVPFHI